MMMAQAELIDDGNESSSSSSSTASTASLGRRFSRSLAHRLRRTSRATTDLVDAPKKKKAPSSNHEASTSLGENSSLLGRWSTSRRRAKSRRSMSADWWQEFEREVDPALLPGAAENAASDAGADLPRPSATRMTGRQPEPPKDKPHSRFTECAPKVLATAVLHTSTVDRLTATATVKPHAQCSQQRIARSSTGGCRPHSYGGGDLFDNVYDTVLEVAARGADLDESTLRTLTPEQRQQVLRLRWRQRLQVPDMEMPSLNPVLATITWPSPFSLSQALQARRQRRKRALITERANTRAAGSLPLAVASAPVVVPLQRTSSLAAALQPAFRRRSRRKGLGDYPYGVHLLGSISEHSDDDNDEEDENDNAECESLASNITNYH
ncbi:hypothetical protein THASP1DRAFT_33721, partial [Thamnocephalis sphaerospora]